jgi:hypothetical protein
MKLRIAVITILCVGIVCSASMLSNQTYAQGKKSASSNGPVVMPKITVFNPMGKPPPITLVPQAPRLDTLDGKTVYLINTGYIGSDRFMAETEKWFKANYPKTNIVYRDNQSGAGLASLSDALWAEVEEKGDAVIAGLGH